MKILNIAHVSYPVSDLEKTLDFYVGCLGLKKKFSMLNSEFMDAMQGKDSRELDALGGSEMTRYFERLKANPDDVWLVYLEVAPHQYIELFPGAAERAPKAMMFQSGLSHLALEVDDIFKARDELLAKSVKVTSDIALGLEKTYQMWIMDPDGNPIELMQYTEDSYQLIGRE